MTCKLFFLGTMMSLSVFSVRAQQTPAKLYQKMEQLFTVMNMPEANAAAVGSSCEQQLAANAELAKFKDELRAYYKKTLAWPEVKGEFEKIYLKNYTEAELDELIKFYSTPAGKKMLTISGNIQREILLMEQALLEANKDELNNQIKAKKQ